VYFFLKQYLVCNEIQCQKIIEQAEGPQIGTPRLFIAVFSSNVAVVPFPGVPLACSMIKRYG